MIQKYFKEKKTNFLTVGFEWLGYSRTGAFFFNVRDKKKKKLKSPIPMGIFCTPPPVYSLKKMHFKTVSYNGLAINIVGFS